LKPVFLEGNVTVVSIALIHTLFNLGTTIILSPFAKQLEKLAKKTVKGTPGEQQRYAYLDERLLVTPTMAIAQCRNMILEMSVLARDTVMLALGMVIKYNEKSADQIRENEGNLDSYEDHLNTFLLKLSGFELSESDGWHVGQLLHIIGDLERMGDHALNILESVEEIRDKDSYFSEIAMQEVDVIHAALLDIVNMTIEAFKNSDIGLSYQVEPLEQVIDNLTGKMRSRHIARLQKGECTVVLGLAWSDLLINYERISDHCSNIAFTIIQSGDHKKDRHALFTEERIRENTEFITAYNEYESKYELK
jgi:phosphate:Na+ symporter